MSGIHQFVPMLHRGDAVGRHTMHLRDLMVARGIHSRIYVEKIDPETASECHLHSAFSDEREPGDVLLYQFATASVLAPWLIGRSETLVVNYHNVTPPEYYGAWDNGLARHQLKARSQLASLAPRTALGVAVSAFNEAELRSAGYVTTAVVPPAAMLPTGTTTTALLAASSTVTLRTVAGLRALATKVAGSGCHWATSIFSPFSSLTTF